MEIIPGVERRRRWRCEEKLRIVAEVERPGASFNDVARRHEVSRGLLWTWRRQVVDLAASGARGRADAGAHAGYLLNPGRARLGPVGWHEWPDRHRHRAAPRCR